MKKLLVLTAVLLLSVAPAMAGNYLKGTVGYFSPTESKIDGAITLNVAGGINLKEQLAAPVSVELGIGYTAPESGDLTIIPITLTGLYELPLNLSNTAFNVGAGLGLYMWDANGGPDGLDFGFHVQAGAEFALNEQLALIGEVKWAKVDFDNFDGGGTSVNVGAKYNF